MTCHPTRWATSWDLACLITDTQLSVRARDKEAEEALVLGEVLGARAGRVRWAEGDLGGGLGGAPARVARRRACAAPPW